MFGHNVVWDCVVWDCVLWDCVLWDCVLRDNVLRVNVVHGNVIRPTVSVSINFQCPAFDTVSIQNPLQRPGFFPVFRHFRH